MKNYSYHCVSIDINKIMNYFVHHNYQTYMPAAFTP